MRCTCKSNWSISCCKQVAPPIENHAGLVPTKDRETPKIFHATQHPVLPCWSQYLADSATIAHHVFEAIG